MKRRWYHLWGRDEKSRERIDRLEKQMEELLAERKREKEEWEPPSQKKNHPALVIEQLYVDKIVVDKLEHTNNIGSIDVTDLGGTLNIGANYGAAIPSEQLDQILSDFAESASAQNGQDQAAEKKETKTQGPKCNIRGKPV